jgi:hypothetical protein
MNENYEQNEGDFTALPYETAEQELARREPFCQEISKCYKVVMEICRQTNLPESARNLIDALICLSNGKTSKEPIKISDSRIARTFYKNEAYCEALSKRVQRWRNSLDEWQEKTGVTFIQIVKPGHRDYTQDEEGKLQSKNVPSKYRVVILEMAAEIFSKGDVSIEAAVSAVLNKFGDIPARLDKKSKRPITTERCRKSSLSFMRKALEIAMDEGYLDEVVKELKEDCLNLIAEFDSMSRTNSSHLNENSGTNDNTINTLSISFPDFLTTHSATIVNQESILEINNISINQPQGISAQNLSMTYRAIELGRRGFRVFPVYNAVDGICSCALGPGCKTSAKHPRIKAWEVFATTNEEQIKDWWRRWRRANIGIVTGEYDNRNIAVLDIDPKSNGFESLKILETKFGQLPKTLTAKTGSGGQHRIFSAPLGIEIGNVQNSIKLGKGLDIRGKNGFIVGAGSIHNSGNRYEWLDEDIQIAEMPIWLIEKLAIQAEQVSKLEEKSSTTKTTGLKKISIQAELIHEHEGRNNFLFNKAIGLFYGGHQKSDVFQRINDWNNKVCSPAVERDELQKLINSAEKTWKKGPSVKEPVL